MTEESPSKKCKHKSSWKVQACFALCIFLVFVVDCVEGKRKTPREHKKRETDHTTGLWFVGVMFFLCFIPALGVFAWNVWKDPDTPQLVENLVNLAKEKAFGNLSTKAADKAAVNKKPFGKAN